MTRFKQILPRKVEFARDVLVTLIHDRKLVSGDRLPAYSKLRDELGLGSQTIAGAVGLLCEAGVLEVRDKVGIFVKDPAGGLLAGRTIAVAVRPLEGSAYAATLAGFIQRELSERSCRCLTFYRNSDADASRSELADFPGLEQSLAEHRCHGVISLCPFSEQALDRIANFGIRCCFIGDDDQHFMNFGVVIEVGGFLDSARDELRKRGCRNVVQLAVSAEQLRLRSGHGMKGFVGASYDGGAEIARELLALPPENRPDGIVSDDDTVVSGFLAELVSAQLPEVRYLPVIATIVHRELGERYPSGRMLLYEQSIGEYSALAVDLLLSALRGKELENPRIVYRFKPVESLKRSLNSNMEKRK